MKDEAPLPPPQEESLKQPQLSNPTKNCNHGCSLANIPPICREFIKTFFDTWKVAHATDDNRITSNFTAMRRTFEKYPDVWDSGSTLLAPMKSILVAYAVDAILYQRNKSTSEYVGYCPGFAGLILAFEGFCCGVFEGIAAATKCEYIFHGGDRAVVKYLSKHSTCGCLKPIWAELKKTQPKISVCDYCKKSPAVSNVIVCSKCEVYEYCSKECQNDARSTHRYRCQIFAEE